MQIETRLESAWCQRLKLKYDKLLSSLTSTLNMRRYMAATILGEVAPGFTVSGSLALYSGGSTLVPLGAAATKPITRQDTWRGGASQQAT